MKAVILAGGYGSRVMPMTHYVPKPLLPLVNRPVLDYAISRVVQAGIKDITLALGYKPEQIEDYVRGYMDIKIKCVRENQCLGTAGSVKNAIRATDSRYFNSHYSSNEDIIVLSADVLCNADLKNLIKRHIESKAYMTVETTFVEDLSRYGEIYKKGNFLKLMKEKDEENKNVCGEANAGAYILSPEALNNIPDNEPYDFAKDLIPALLKKGKRISCEKLQGYWRDIGSLKDYYRANYEVKKLAPIRLRHVRRNIERYMGSSVVCGNALVSGKIDNCIIGEGAIVTSSASLKNCIVLPGELVEKSATGEILGGTFSLNPEWGNVNLKNINLRQNFFLI